MGQDMSLRDLYLPAGTTIDLVAATAAVTDLCQHATLDDLLMLLNEGWFDFDDVDDPAAWTADTFTQRAEALRTAAEHGLLDVLDTFVASLRWRDVARFRFDRDSGTGADAYMTGGLTSSDGPTEAYDAWDIVFNLDRFPDGWTERIGAACGLIHPRGDGPAALTVTFHAWAAPTEENATP